MRKSIGRVLTLLNSFFRYNEHHLLVSGNAEDVMKDINSDMDNIIEYNANEL